MERGGAHDAPVLVGTGLIVLTITCAVSAYRAAAAGDAGSTAFVAVTYSTLLLLFRVLRAYERLPPGDGDEAAGAGRRARLRREVWALCALLTVLFASKVAAAMPSGLVASAVWAMAALTVAGGGYVALLNHHPP